MAVSVDLVTVGNLKLVPGRENEWWVEAANLWAIAYGLLYIPEFRWILRASYLSGEDKILYGLKGFDIFCHAHGVQDSRALLRLVGHPEAEGNPYEHVIDQRLGNCNFLGNMQYVLLWRFNQTGVDVHRMKVERCNHHFMFVDLKDQDSKKVDYRRVRDYLDDLRQSEDWEDQPESFRRKVGSIIKTLSNLIRSDEESADSDISDDSV